LEEVLQS